MPEAIPPADEPEETPAPQEQGASLVYQPQEAAHDSPRSHCTFRVGPGVELLMTPAALAEFGIEAILAAFYRLLHLATVEGGLDYLQVFEDPATRQELWFIEDATGVVTALLPDDR